jgi:hypothetical protein
MQRGTGGGKGVTVETGGKSDNKAAGQQPAAAAQQPVGAQPVKA